MVFAILLACSEPVQPAETPSEPVFFQTGGQALGTTWSVKWTGTPTVEAVDELAAEVLASVDKQMSTWRKDSELQQVRDGSGPVGVSAETASVTRSALELAKATGGAFDPTVQPLMELWGFHRSTPLESMPTDEQVATALGQMGWNKVTVAQSADGWTIDAAGTALDLSAIAKGDASDRVAAALQQAGATQWMVEVGGEVAVKGGGPRGTGWRLAVDEPTVDSQPGEDLIGVLTVTDHGIATSGNYRNRRSTGDKSWGHTMDPRVGRPVPTPVLSASVIAPTTRQADGLATAMMVLGPDEGLAEIERRPGVEAILLVADGEKGWQVRQSSGAEAFFSPVPQ